MAASTRLADLSVEITANMAPLRAALARADRETAAFGTRMTAAFRVASAGLAGGAAGLAAAKIVNLSDKYRELQNSLKVAGLAGEQLTAVYRTLTAQAERNFVPVEAMVKLFSSTAQASKDLGKSTGDVLKFTNTVAQALRIAGTNPEAASGALLQLGQMLGSAKVQSEEFNSVAEGIRPLMQAAADGIEEAGGSISKLKQLVVAGQVSNKAFFEGAQIGATKFEEKLSGSTTTVSGSLTNVQTAFMNLVGAIDGQTGFTDDIVLGFEKLSTFIKFSQGLVVSFGEEFNAAGRFLDGFKTKVDALAQSLGWFAGLSNLGKPINKFFESADYSDDMDGLAAKAGVEDLERGLAKARDRYDELNRVVSDNPAMRTEITALGKQIEDTTRKIEAMRAAATRAPTSETAQSIIAATPVADLPAFSMPKVDTSGKPISLSKYKTEDKNDPAAKAAERHAKAVKELIADLEDELRVAGLSAAQQQVAANQRRVNAAAASAEGKEIEALTLKLEKARQAARDRDDDLRAQQDLRATQQDLDLTLAGAGTRAVEATRYAREKLFEIERQAAENGPEWARQRMQGLQREAALVGDLAEKAKQADLYRDAIFERQQAPRGPRRLHTLLTISLGEIS